MTFVFWGAVALLFYVIIGYGLLLMVLAMVMPRKSVCAPVKGLTVDFLIPAHNEAACIADKIRNTLALENPHGHSVRVWVVSDGSSDKTVALAQALAAKHPQVRVIETPGRLGKLAAMNMVMPQLDGDIVVFSDANAMLAPKTLKALMRHFGDAQVGGVCGQISVGGKGTGQIGKAEGFFWRYDQALKAAEGQLGGVVSAQGSIYAMRRKLVPDVPPGAADDFFISVAAVDAGFLLAFEPQATTREAVTEKAGKEMGRRIRSTEMGWRALMHYRHLMNPLRTGLYGWQLFSHKFLRRMAPFALIALFISNAFLLDAGLFYQGLFAAQVAGYGLTSWAWFSPWVRRLPLVGKGMFFVMGNLAMLLGLVQYWRGQESSIWTPVRES